MKEEDKMFSIIFGGIGIIFDLLIIGAVVVCVGKVIVKIIKGIRNIIDSLR